MEVDWKLTEGGLGADWEQTFSRIKQNRSTRAQWNQNGSRMEPEWSQNGARMEPEWNQNEGTYFL